MMNTMTLQKALFTIKKLKKLSQKKSKNLEPIAIIGLGCRFPLADNKDQFWKMLVEGTNAVTELPEERWNLLKGSDEISKRDNQHKYFGSFLDNLSGFDAYFFGISPREAIRMEPQQRLLLEVAYEALEDAGLPLESLAGSNTGVFTSLYASQYGHLQNLETDLDALFLPTGNAISIAANRLSYLFDLHGPSIVFDTACSSSLVALHIACLNLQNNLCDTALVCGANINLLPSLNSVLAKAKMLSPDGQCKTFDAGANGYVPGEGIGVAVLKPLSKALQDHDRIYGVIAGSGVNQDGRTNGLTAPNGLQQENLLKSVYQTANINPQEISYVECHGTGTFLGDPIEIQALGEVVGKQRDQHPCRIGSVKTNIGHLEPAAGIASLIKVALALKHKQIPPHLNYSVPNPHIDFEKYHLQIPINVQEWTKYGKYRLAGISGFGFGGTNAHIIVRELDESEKIENRFEASKQELFTLSAKDQNALMQLVTKWCDYLENNPTLHLGQLCYNTHVRRSHFSHRLAIITHSISHLLEQLQSLNKNFKNSELIYLSSEKCTIEIPKNISLDNCDLVSIAKYYVNNAAISWQEFEKNRKFECIDMPSYCWQHKEYWPSFEKSQALPISDHPFKGHMLLSPLKTVQFNFQFDTKSFPEIHDTYNILHAGFYLEMLTFAVEQLNLPIKFTINDLTFVLALIVPDNTVISVQLIIDQESNKFNFYSYSASQNKWLEHANGSLSFSDINNYKAQSIINYKEKCQQTEHIENLYNRILNMGMPAGDTIRWAKQYWFNEKEIFCELNTPASCTKQKFAFDVHPGIIDGCIQPLFKLVPLEYTKPYMASTIKNIRIHGKPNKNLFLFGNIQEISSNGDQIKGNAYLLNESNELIIEFEDITLSQLENKIEIQKMMQNQQKVDITLLSADDRKQHVINFLIDQVAIVCSMPKQDIDIHRSLTDYGVDSLMALVLMRALEAGLDTAYSMQALLDGPSITQISDAVLAKYNDSSPTIKTEFSSPWIAYRKAKSEPLLRLFCLPYGGSGASVFRDWQNDLPDNIEVCPIQLPGRENRMSEQPLHDIKIVIENLLNNIENLFDVPFAFFGHSFGALIAFELTRHLRKHQLPMPEHLFLSAYPDPRTPTKNLDKMLNQLNYLNISLADIQSTSGIEKLTDEQLFQLSDVFNQNGIVDYGDHLLNRDVIKILLPIFIGDMSIVKSYQYHDEAALDVPMTIFIGKNDSWIDYQDQLTWNQHTNKNCITHEFSSGHLFIKEKIIKQEILHLISQTFKMKQDENVETS